MMKPNPQKGIAILIAVVAVSAMLLIALAISDISYKEQIITFFGRDSKTAFYASNAGLECALFHDYGGGVTGNFQFPTSTDSASIGPGDIRCGDAPDNPVDGYVEYDVDDDAESAITSFYFNINDTPRSCSIVRVSKIKNGAKTNTRIESRGYNNTCDESRGAANPALTEGNPRNLERALLMTY